MALVKMNWSPSSRQLRQFAWGVAVVLPLVGWLWNASAGAIAALAVTGALLGLVGQFGDLVGSLLKRSTGVKNSGRVPGFGGVLDLADSAYFAAPAALLLLRLAADSSVG